LKTDENSEGIKTQKTKDNRFQKLKDENPQVSHPNGNKSVKQTEITL